MLTSCVVETPSRVKREGGAAGKRLAANSCLTLLRENPAVFRHHEHSSWGGEYLPSGRTSIFNTCSQKG